MSIVWQVMNELQRTARAPIFEPLKTYMKFKQMWFIFGSQRKQINHVETWNNIFHFLDCISSTVAHKKCNY